MTEAPERIRSVMDPAGMALGEVYAQSLLEIAPDNAQAEQIARELAAVAELLDQVAGLNELLSPGMLSQKTQSEVVAKVFAGRVSREVEAFLSVLVLRGRSNLLKTAVAAFRRLLDRRQGKVEVSVTTAVELSEGQKEALAAALRAAIGAEPLLELKVNRDILGGVVVHVGDSVYDASVATELKRMKRRLTGPAAA
jgi:F-type H+-transporting ATPase subunit delta